MVRTLCPKFHLPQSPVRPCGSFPDCFSKQFRLHKMGTGTGDQKTAVTNQLDPPQINLPISFYGIFHGISRFCKRRRIQDDDIKPFSLLFQLRQKFKYIRTLKMYSVFQLIESRIFPGLFHRKK